MFVYVCIIHKISNRVNEKDNQKNLSMPVHKSYKDGKAVGWRYGRSGTVYRTRADAVRQAQAIKIAQAEAKKK